jgi:hypothetical protein
VNAHGPGEMNGRSQVTSDTSDVAITITVRSVRSSRLRRPMPLPATDITDDGASKVIHDVRGCSLGIARLRSLGVT